MLKARGGFTTIVDFVGERSQYLAENEDAKVPRTSEERLAITYQPRSRSECNS